MAVGGSSSRCSERSVKLPISPLGYQWGHPAIVGINGDTQPSVQRIHALSGIEQLCRRDSVKRTRVCLVSAPPESRCPFHCGKMDVPFSKDGYPHFLRDLRPSHLEPAANGRPANPSSLSINLQTGNRRRLSKPPTGRRPRAAVFPRRTWGSKRFWTGGQNRDTQLLRGAERAENGGKRGRGKTGTANFPNLCELWKNIG